jgi:hypothetical protein
MFVDLSQIVEYLYEHKEMIFVLPGQNGALTYNPATDEVVILWGDFSGPEEDIVAECNLRLKHHNAWLN